MINLFVSDMDGTLLDGHHQINNLTADTIKKWQADGREFLIATGRDYASASRLLQEHHIRCAMINLNGALIHNSDGQVLAKYSIEKSTSKAILDFLETIDVIVTLSTETDFYMSNQDRYIAQLNHYYRQRGQGDMTQAQVEAHLKDALDLNQFFQNSDQEVLKMMIISNQPDLLEKCRQFLQAYDDIDITSSDKANLELTSIKAQKGLALKTYLTLANHTMDTTATIGDSLNDRSMLALFPHSYAMENASDEIKRLAQHVAPKNTENGVAQVMASLLEESPED